jgi:predicted transcriptional regulator
MPSIKQQALDMITRLPDDVDMEAIMYHLSVIDKINKGLKDSAEGRTISHEDAKKKFGIK